MLKSLQEYQFDDLRKDIDPSVSDAEKILVVCNTFHGHALPYVSNNLPLSACLYLEFQHLMEEYETFVLQINALLLEHVTQAQ